MHNRFIFGHLGYVTHTFSSFVTTVIEVEVGLWGLEPWMLAVLNP